MKLRTFLLIAVIAAWMGRDGVRAARRLDVDASIGTFQKHWDKFLRAYMGCPKGATDIGQCDAKQGVWDYAEFLKAAKASRELFEMESQ